MEILVTGSSSGIGKAIAERFLQAGHRVHGIDVQGPAIGVTGNYSHHVADITDKASLPQLEGIGVLVNCAGVQDSGRDIEVNLTGTINVSEKYGVREGIRSILMIASASAHTGAEFPEYSASKGGMLSYMKNVARRVAAYGATCNSISPGGVTTELNRPVMDDPVLWGRIMDQTPLKRWASPGEIAEWAYFMTVTNRFCTGQDIVIDGGEKDLNGTFVWPGQSPGREA